MNKVSTINLAGRAYQVEEAGFDALRQYLDQAALKLASDPDKAEILNDLETAIAGKCDNYLTQHKNVITTSDMSAILHEMGPVAGGSDDSTDTGAANDAHAENSAPKRLYRIREGEMISGVCNGIAAYFNVDVTLVRLLFVLAALFTGGGFVFAYFLMIVFIPFANTPKERAEAYGEPILTAQDLVNRAKTVGYEKWNEWKRASHEQKKHLKKQWRYAAQYSHPQTVYYRSWVDELVGTFIGFFWLAVITFSLWWGYHHVLPIRELFNSIGIALDHFFNSLGNR